MLTCEKKKKMVCQVPVWRFSDSRSNMVWEAFEKVSPTEIVDHVYDIILRFNQEISSKRIAERLKDVHKISWIYN